MGLLDGLRGLFNSSSSASPDSGPKMDGDRYQGGLSVDSALKRSIPRPIKDDENFYVYGQHGSTDIIPAVYRAIDLLSGVMARLPKVVAKIDDPILDSWTPLYDHPVSVLMQAPSRFWDTWQFWRWMYKELFTGGNSYAEIQKFGGYPVELYPTDIQATMMMGLPSFKAKRIIGRMQYRPIQPSHFVGFHAVNFDGLSSPSPVYNYAMRTMGLAHSASAYNARSLDGGFSTRVAVEIDPIVGLRSRGQGEDLQAKIKASFSGAAKTGGTIVLPPGAKLVSTQGMLSNVDVALIDLLKMTVLDIARIFGIPPVLLMHYHDNFQAAKAVEIESENFTRWSIRSPVEMVQQQLTSKLLLPEERFEGLAIRMPTDSLQLGSFSEIAKAVDLAVARAGVMTINEGRRRMRLPDRPDGDKLIEPKGAPKQDGEGKDED